MSGIPYTDDEKRIMRRWYGKVRLGELVAMLPAENNRTAAGVKEWCRRQGMRSELRWKRPDIRLSDEFYDRILIEACRDSYSVIAERHGVPRGTVSGWVARGKAYRYGKESTVQA